MRSYGGGKRNDPIELENPRPVPRYENPIHTGDVGVDGYELLSRAFPQTQGRPPAVEGTVGRTFQGPDSSFEQ